MRKLFLTLVLGLMVFVTACGNESIETNMSEKVADFEFTTQDNDTLSLEDLEGQWWVTDFVFTNCTTTCLPMTSNMASLQDKILDEEINNVKLVSFSVDPENDTPEVLKEYAEQHEADPQIWSFLTGYDFDTVKELSIKSFRNLVQEAEPGSNQVMHGTRFFLVNPEGEVVKHYDGVKADEMDVILEDLKSLVN